MTSASAVFPLGAAPRCARTALSAGRHEAGRRSLSDAVRTAGVDPMGTETLLPQGERAQRGICLVGLPRAAARSRGRLGLPISASGCFELAPSAVPRIADRWRHNGCRLPVQEKTGVITYSLASSKRASRGVPSHDPPKTSAGPSGSAPFGSAITTAVSSSSLSKSATRCGVPSRSLFTISNAVQASDVKGLPSSAPSLSMHQTKHERAGQCRHQIGTKFT
jgi:hypothetical protein